MPIDKSMTIRMLMLDMAKKRTAGTELLAHNFELPDDVKFAIGATEHIRNRGTTIRVGESATLLRFLMFYNWLNKLNLQFVRQGTLINRQITDKPEIIHWSLKRLLNLDQKTSQWASAAYLFIEDRRRIPSRSPHKLYVTRDAVEMYNDMVGKCGIWIPPKDKTILRQARAAVDWVNGDRAHGGQHSYFYASHSEDYCFARVFNRITLQKGMELWPQLANHESNRFTHTEEAIQLFEQTGQIVSNDHRVVQALVLKATLERKPFNCTNVDCVSKSWPRFWDFQNSIQTELAK